MSAWSTHHWDRRSVLRAAMGLAAAGGLAACGGNTGRDGGPGSGKRLVQYFHAYGEAGTEQAIRRYAKAYEEADVTTQWITGSNFESKLFASLLTDKAPDVFEFHPQIQLVKSGQVADLTDLVEPVQDDFNPADIQSHTVDGKIYGVRMIDDPQFFFYRKSMFEKAGVGVPTTLDELLATAAELTTDKVKGIYLGNTLHPIVNPMIWASGADTLDEKNEIAYHTDGVVGGSAPCASSSPAVICCSTRRPTSGTPPRSTRGSPPSSGAACGRCRRCSRRSVTISGSSPSRRSPTRASRQSPTAAGRCSSTRRARTSRRPRST